MAENSDPVASSSDPGGTSQSTPEVSIAAAKPSASSKTEQAKRVRSWRKALAQSSTAWFVLSRNLRLRYANPAWEQATGANFSRLRGMRLSPRGSGSDLGRTLSPPAEVWRGESVVVRRAAPGMADGPPWWQLSFVPFQESAQGTSQGSSQSAVQYVLGTLSLHGERLPKKSGGKIPAEFEAVRHKWAQASAISSWPGTSILAEQTRDYLRLAALGRGGVKLVGESGSGKRWAARLLHQAQASAVAERPWIPLDPIGVQPYLLDAMLFGRGGVWGVAGSIYLREPGELPGEYQEKILRAAERPRAPRLIWGTTRPVDARRLPAWDDRWAVPTILLPPLRDRLGDIAAMVAAWFGPDFPLRDETYRVLQAHRWPGNLTELRQVLLQAVANRPESASGVEPAHLPRWLREKKLIQDHPLIRPELPCPLPELLERVESRLIQAAFAAESGSLAAAARRLGISRASLARRRTAGIQPPEPPTAENSKP